MVNPEGRGALLWERLGDIVSGLVFLLGYPPTLAGVVSLIERIIGVWLAVVALLPLRTSAVLA